MIRMGVSTNLTSLDEGMGRYRTLQRLVLLPTTAYSKGPHTAANGRSCPREAPDLLKISSAV